MGDNGKDDDDVNDVWDNDLEGDGGGDNDEEGSYLPWYFIASPLSNR